MSEATPNGRDLDTIPPPAPTPDDDWEPATKADLKAAMAQLNERFSAFDNVVATLQEAADAIIVMHTEQLKIGREQKETAARLELLEHRHMNGGAPAPT